MGQSWTRILVRLSSLSLLMITVLSLPAWAQPIAGKWSNVGPEQALIKCITVDPVDHNNIYVGTHTGAFKSTDGGQNWFNTNGKGLPNFDIFSIVVDPVNNKNVYLLTPYYLVKSTDGGTNWSILHTKIDLSPGVELNVSQIIVDYGESNIVYAKTLRGLIKSNDGGNTWNIVQTSMGSDEVLVSVGINQLDHKTIYVGVRKRTNLPNPAGPNDFQDRILLSPDSGATWQELANTTLRVLGEDDRLKFNAAALITGTTLWGNGGIAIGACYPGYGCMDIGLDCVQVKSVSQSLVCTTNNGQPSNVDVSRTPGNRSALFPDYAKEALGTNDFCLGPGCPFFPFSDISYMVIDPSDPSTLYVDGPNSADGESLYKSTDGAKTWKPIVNGLNNSTVHALAVDPSRPGTIFAGGSSYSVDGGLSKRVDEQSIFKKISEPLTKGKDFTAIAFNPRKPNIIFAGANGIIYRSMDAGLTWNVAIDSSYPGSSYYFPVVRSIVFDSAASDTVYAAFFTRSFAASPGVIKSNDGGQTWTQVNNGLPSLNVNTLAADPRSAGTLYAGFDSSLYRTSDGGANWQLVSPNNCCAVDVIAFDDAHPGTIYALGDGLQKSVDNGTTWTLLISPYSNNRYHFIRQGFNWSSFGFSSIVFDPLHPDTMYVGANTPPFRMLDDDHNLLFKGVFKSTNGGLSWWPLNEGLTTPFVTSLVSDPSNGKLYAGTEGGGVFVSQPTQSPRAGDVNGDGKIDVRDLIALANGLAGNLQLDPFSADIFADGQINVQDLLALCQYLAGNVDKLPIAPSQ